MYNVDDLNKMNYIKHLDQLDLKVLCEYYTDELEGKEYVYTIRSKDDTIHKLSFKFMSSSLAHLLGLQHLNKHKDYRGELAYTNMKNGVITLGTLKTNPNFKFIKSRIQYFPYLVNILKTPYLCDFDKLKIVGTQKGKTLIDVDFFIYEEYVEEKSSKEYTTKIHLGLKSNRNDKYKTTSQEKMELLLIIKIIML